MARSFSIFAPKQTVSKRSSFHAAALTGADCLAGCNGQIPKGGTEAAPLELFVANAGTAARFLSVTWVASIGAKNGSFEN